MRCTLDEFNTIRTRLKSLGFNEIGIDDFDLNPYLVTFYNNKMGLGNLSSVLEDWEKIEEFDGELFLSVCSDIA